MEDKKTDANNILYVVNKYINWKTSARKSYIRKKVIANDMTDDITQLCYQLYNLSENKVVVVNDNQENIDMKRNLLKYEKEIFELKVYKEKYESSNRHNKQKRKLLDEQLIEINNLKQQLLETKQINETKTNIKPKKKKTTSVFDFDDEPLDIPDDYDPYNENIPIDNSPLTMDDYTAFEIESVIGQVGRYKWNTLSTDERLNKMIELH